MSKTATMLPLLALFLCVPDAFGQSEDRPSSPRLLPGDSLAYFRIDDVADFRVRMRESSGGRMLNDPKVKPLVSDVYRVVSDLVSGVSERMGVTMDELLAIPQGELTIALAPVDPESELQRIQTPPGKKDEIDEKDESPEAIRKRLQRKRRQQRLRTRLSFGAIAIMDVGEQLPVVRRMLDQTEAQMIGRGFKATSETIGDIDIVSLRQAGRPASLHYAIHDSALVISSKQGLVRDALRRWQGDLDDETLSSETDFTTIMSHCMGAENTRPQITFFVDPVGILDAVTGSGVGAGMFLFVIENIGLDGIKGLGGSQFMGGERFETIAHFHVLLDSRRNGVLSTIRPQAGSIQPPTWAPEDVENVTTVHWDVDRTVAAVRRLYDQFRGEGSFDEDLLVPVGKQMKVDYQQDVLAQLTGRFSMVRWLEPPSRLGSQVHMFGAGVKDAAAMAETLEKSMEVQPDWESRTFAGVTVYAGRESKVPDSMRDFVRVGRPHVAIIGDDLVFTSSEKLIERAIRTASDGGPGRVADLPEFDLVVAEMSEQLADRKPFLFSFTQPEQSFRVVYELLNSPEMREGLRRLAESSDVARMFHEAIESNELPPLATFTQYFAPAGAYGYDDTSGLHIASFGLAKQ